MSLHLCRFGAVVLGACKSAIMALKLHTYPGNKNAFKALIAAQYIGVPIEVPPFNMGVDNKKPEFLKLNPNGKVCHLLAALDACAVRSLRRLQALGAL